MTLGERIKKVRKALDLTQQEFADKIGSKRNTVATYEIGRTEPSAAVMTLICREFNIDETWLRTGEGEMFLRTPDTAIGQLAKELGLDEFMQGVVSEYLKLNEEQRKVVREFVNKIAEQPIKEPPAAPTPAPPPQSEPGPELELEPEDALDDDRLLAIMAMDPADMTDEELVIYGKELRRQAIKEKEAKENVQVSPGDTWRQKRA